MKKEYLTVIYAFIVGLIFSACADKNTTTAQPSAGSQPAAGAYSGRVVETMNSGGYTYVKIDTGKDTIWTAAPETQVTVGDSVSVLPGTLMRNFKSDTLDRTFEQIYFVAAISGAGAGQAAAGDMGAYHAGIQKESKNADPAAADFSGITKPDGGKSVAELFAQKKDLSGTEVLVRGKVVKYNARIMDKNWIHLQDGTGTKGLNDLTVNTSAEAKVGDTVLVKGVLVTNKDYGYGYKYDVIIEDAEVTVEK